MTPAGLAKGKVTVMAAADHDGPGPDLYQLLGVPQDAPREEIAQAWRRRARDEHPDRQPGEAADEAAARFRVLAGAWRVLGDPARRAAYDRALAREQPPVTPVSAQRPSRPGWSVGTTLPVRVAGPPLRAGPVWIEGGPGRQAGRCDEADVRLALLAELLRYLAPDGGGGG